MFDSSELRCRLCCYVCLITFLTVFSRFLSSMLHNPHLGLTGTLEKLYELAKVMADCVVPQEYGSSIEEKRSIGTKMCGALLEKIK
jgi:hypothetical protein